MPQIYFCRTFISFKKLMVLFQLRWLEKRSYSFNYDRVNR